MNPVLDELRDIIQEDVGRRGLRTDPASNLISACPDDSRLACASIAAAPKPVVAVVTGFYIPTAQPPAGETDGPLGAVFLARALVPLGCRVLLCSDGFCEAALRAGLAACGLQQQVTLITLADYGKSLGLTAAQYFQQHLGATPPTHLIALERVGPSHTLDSLQRQRGEALGEAYLDFLDACPPEHHDRCHTMRGRDITEHMSPAHLLFEHAFLPSPPGRGVGGEGSKSAITTIGIGDGGNEIGMGKIPWDVIHRNIPGGGLVACRVPTTHLIVCGISNWGAYALARGVWLLRGRPFPAELADPENERRILQAMVERGPLVDGVTGQPTISVDGLDFDKYIDVLPRLARVQ
jgi:hypothetical protein